MTVKLTLVWTEHSAHWLLGKICLVLLPSGLDLCAPDIRIHANYFENIENGTLVSMGIFPEWEGKIRTCQNLCLYLMPSTFFVHYNVCRHICSLDWRLYYIYHILYNICHILFIILIFDIYIFFWDFKFLEWTNTILYYISCFILAKLFSKICTIKFLPQF